MPHTPGYTNIPIPESLSSPIQLSAKALIEFDADDPQQVAAAKSLAAIHQAASEMYELIKDIEFVADGVTTWCPCCGENPPVHTAPCRIAAVLKAVEGES